MLQDFRIVVGLLHISITRIYYNCSANYSKFTPHYLPKHFPEFVV